MRPLRTAIIGFGKIAADQHVPSIAANPRLELVATSSRSGQGVATTYSDWRKLLDEVEGLEAVAITTPPSVRYEIARACIEKGLHVLLEERGPDTAQDLVESREVRLQHGDLAAHPAQAAGHRRAVAHGCMRARAQEV